MRYDSQRRGFMDKNGNYGIVDECGNIDPYKFDPRMGPRDKHGNRIEIVGFHLGPRTKYTHPYNYDALLQWKKYERTPADAGAVYSDRLWQQDYSLYRRLCQEHFAGGNDKGGDYFGSRSPEKIEKFLRAFFGNPELELVRIEEHCNQSSGYPVWAFFYRSPSPAGSNPLTVESGVTAAMPKHRKSGSRPGSKARNKARVKARNLARGKAAVKARRKVSTASK